jgi:N-acetylmuramate 1-kinase
MIPISDQVTTFINTSLNAAHCQIYQLAGDASARKYYRVIHNDKTYVLMVWEPFVESNYPFINVLQQFHYAKVNVPKIVAIEASLGVILLEDLGDLTLERKYWEATQPENSWEFYQKALDEIIKIHTTATTTSNPKITTNIAKNIEFDVAKFMWEMNYAKTHLIQGLLRFKMSDTVAAELDKTFNHFCTKLHQEPKVICHRDYHSRNLMIKLNNVFVIDFQDARMGPIQYDLVSLLKDSYVDISDSYADKMLKYYFEKTNFVQLNKQGLDHFQSIYELQSIQRCFKACGSFASFMNAREDKRYLKYLPGTLKHVARSLEIFPEYKILQTILVDSGALEKNYAAL